MKTKSMSELQEILNQVGAPLGVSVAEIEFKQGKNPALTIFIEKEGGVDLDTCEAFHRAVDAPIDDFDPTYGQPYTLNVSSLGVDRPFKTEKDFLSHIGEMVEVKLYASIRGKKFYEGILTAYDGKTITLKVDEKNTFTIELKNVVKINEYIEFN
ncbi:MAG: ribosome maturation factor RimP [Clostridiales bacterium]|nr:ribosome maturation factor RimP [Clostridiales bacterium]